MAPNPLDRSGYLRRRILQSAASIGVLSGTAAGASSHRTDADETGVDGDASDETRDEDAYSASGTRSSSGIDITLVTGHKITVCECEDDGFELIAEPGLESLDVVETAEGTYVLPKAVDIDRYGRECFHIEYLIDQGLTDEETDTIPVIVMVDDEVDAPSETRLETVDAVTTSTSFDIIDGVAGEISKEAARSADEPLFTASHVERICLSVIHEPMVDEASAEVEAPDARESFDVDGSGVSVAVLDTGIDANHPDFGDRIVDEVDFGPSGPDRRGSHGTHIAGVVAGDGSADDGTYVGVAPGADLMDVRVMPSSGVGPSSWLVEGIEYAVAEGADVINMSLGAPPMEDDPVEDAVNAAVDAGVVVVVSVGHEPASSGRPGYGTFSSPAYAERAITVGATDDESEVSAVSYSGPTPYDRRVKPDVVAPGYRITATGSDNTEEFPYATDSGTSVAAAMVSGIAALLLEQDPDRDPADIADIVRSTARPIDGENVFSQGSGRVNARAALEADLRVENTMTNFGVRPTGVTDTATIPVENVGEESLDLEAEATVFNNDDGTNHPETATVEPSTLSLDSGERAEFVLEIDPEGASGVNGGVLTIDRADLSAAEYGGNSYRALFGFINETEVIVEKIPHEHNDDFGDDSLYVWSRDGEFSELDMYGFDDDGTCTFRTPGDGEFVFWSSGSLDRGSTGTDIALTVDRTEVVDGERTHVTLDETETVLRELETERLEAESLVGKRIRTGLHGTSDDGGTHHFATMLQGEYEQNTIYVSPIDEDDPTNLTSEYVMVPADEDDGELNLDTSTVYHLFYGDRSISPDENVVSIDPDTLAREQFLYHRADEDVAYEVMPLATHPDEDRFPVSSVPENRYAIGEDRIEQTWYLNTDGRYGGEWTASIDWGGPPYTYDIFRAPELRPERGATYYQSFNRDPIVSKLDSWNATDGDLECRGYWYGDQSQRTFTPNVVNVHGANWYEVFVDGEEVDMGAVSSEPGFSTTVSDIDAGSTIELSMRGGELSYESDNERETTTVTDYEVSYEEGVKPPRIDTVHAAGLNLSNELSPGSVPIFVEVSKPTSEFEAFVAETDQVEETPFVDESDWTELDVLHAASRWFVLGVDASAYENGIDLAFAATDRDDNRVETTSFAALDVRTDETVSIEITVLAGRISPDSNRLIPVTIRSTDELDLNRIETDSLRFGSTEAIHRGTGAEAERPQRIDDGNAIHVCVNSDAIISNDFVRASLKRFASVDGFESEVPLPLTVVGELEDGTPFVGTTVVMTAPL